MPVINGVYLKDFAALPSAVVDANIIPIAISGNQIAYRTTVGGIVTNARVTSKLLTGLSVTGGAVVATDTILQAFGKVQNQINSKVSSVGLTMPAAFSVANSPITSAGTLAVTAIGAASQYIRGDGALADFPTTGGGGSSVAYYLNGSVSQGTIGGNAYYEMNKTPVIGTGTDFTIGADGYIAQFITDANDPASLLIPAGNWNVEMYFSASSSGGTPSFYVEVYKYNGTTFTLLGSSATTPEGITNGTAIDIYYTSVGIPETVLAITDRLAIRVYVDTSGRTITLHTEDNHLSEIITTFSNGLTALNGLTKQAQYFAVGSSGTDFNIASSVDTHTFNIPSASASNRGLITTGTQTIAGNKTLTGALVGTTGSFASSGGSDSFAINHSSGAGIALNITKGGNGEGIYVNKTSGSGNAVTIIGTLNATTLVKSGGTSAQFLKADGTVDSTAYGTGSVTSVAALTLGTSGTDLSSTVANSTTTPVITLNVPDASATARGVVTTGTQTFAGAKTFSSDIAVNTFMTVGRGGGAIVSNTAFGFNALFSNTTGQLNTSIGYNSGNLTNAGAANQTSQTSVYIGADTRASANGNTNEIVIGCNGRGLGSNTTVLGNPLTVFGRFWGNLLVGDSSNSGEALQITGTSKFTGALSGTSATFSLDSTVNGVTVGRGAGNISSNTALGLEAFFSGNTTGTNNTAVGVGALRINTASNSTAVGTNALTVSTTAGSNTGIGSYALQNITTGTNNTAIGVESGRGITTGTGNTILGITSVSLAAGLTNNIILSNGTGAIKAQHDGTNWTFTGGTTLTGALSGTSATFSDNVTLSAAATNKYIQYTNNNGSTLITNALNNNSYITGALSGEALILSGTIGKGLRIGNTADNVSYLSFASTGAATFSGNVGIGATPAVKLEVQSSGSNSFFRNSSTTATTTYITVVNANNSSNGLVMAHISDGTGYFGTQNSADLRLVTGDTEKMRITSGGALLINTTSAFLGSNSKLQIIGADAGPTFKNETSAQQSLFLWNSGSSGNNLFVEFGTDTSVSVRGSIDFNRVATLTRYNTISDANLKNLIGDSNKQKSIDILNSTKIREFSWKADETNKPQIGVIAQELYETYKGAVSVGSDSELFDTEEYKNWQVDKTAFTFHLIAGWQKHEEIINDLKSQIEELKALIKPIVPEVTQEPIIPTDNNLE